MADGLGAAGALHRPEGLDGSVPRQRSVGRVAVAVERLGGASRIVRVAESGPLRLRLPTIRDGPPEGVLVNTAGGLACGDDMAVAAEVGEGAALVLTAAAAEKAYRSTGPTTRVGTRLAVAAGGTVEWLPQETILYDRARLHRRLDVDLHASASALLLELVVFGREAHGETVREGSFRDAWRVRRGGRLVFAESVRLDGAIAERLGRPAIGGGNRAVATLVHVAPDAEGRIEEARNLLAGSAAECGATAYGGLLVVRWLAPTIGALRRDVARFMTAFRGRPLPRVWST